MRTKTVLHGALLLAGIAAVPAWAESLTLDQAIAYALGHNPELRAVRERAAATGARRAAAEGAQWPQLGASYGVRRSDSPLDAFADKLNTRRVAAPDFDPARLNHPEASDLYMGQLALRYPVYTGGRVSATIEAARGMERTAELQYARAREIAAFQPLRAYLGAHAAQEGLAIAEDALRAAEEHARTTAGLVREGRIVMSDKLTAEVNLAAVQSQKEQAAARRLRAFDQLKRAMGLTLEREVEIAPAAPAPAAPLRPRAEIEAAALVNRRDLAGQRSAQAAARSRIKAARAAHLPQFSVIAAESWFSGDPALDNRSTSVMGVLSIELYAGGAHQAEVAAAAAEAEETDWRLDGLDQQVRDEVREAYESLREAQARHAIAGANVGRAREAVQLVKQRYGQGRTILIDLLQAERALVEARAEELATRLGIEIGSAALGLAQGALELPAGETP